MSAGPTHDDAAQVLESALTAPELADRVEMVVRPLGPGPSGADRYRAAAVDGSVEFERTEHEGRYRYDVVAIQGRDPLAEQDPAALVGLDLERQGHPDRTANSFPYAFDSIAQFFDGEHAPDLVALHTAAHRVDGNLGQHGSLGVIQGRAPFVAAGAGIRPLGLIDRSARVVDIAPTVAATLGFAPHPSGVGPTGAPRADALLARQDGDPLVDLLDGTTAAHVLVVLLDGCNANLLHDALDSGDAPTIAGLVERGVALRHGATASLPTATLANHTTAITGAHPGHSGVLHNTWVDRTDGSTPDLLSMEQMFWSADHVTTDVETLFEALERNRPGALELGDLRVLRPRRDVLEFRARPHRPARRGAARPGRRHTPAPTERRGVSRLPLHVDRRPPERRADHRAVVRSRPSGVELGEPGGDRRSRPRERPPRRARPRSAA